MNSDIRSAPMSPLVVCSLQMFSILLPDKFYVFSHSLTQVFMVNSLINIQSDKPQNNTCGYFKNELDSLVLLFGV